MRVENQPGWILHARPYRETSLLIECFSRDYGRVGLVARGVRRERSRQPRALLQPLTPLTLAWTGQGELATMTGIEARAQPPLLAGEALVCAMYLNELVMRLAQRQDASPELFDHYEVALAGLVQPTLRAWTLRRFERDILAETGYGIVCECDADSGEPIQPQRDYVYIPEHGAVAWNNQPQALRLRGSALLALDQDRQPDQTDMAALRRLMRALIRHQLAGASLRSWGLVGTLAGGVGDGSRVD